MVSKLHEVGFVLLCYTCLFQVFSNPVNIPLRSVPNELRQRALYLLNETTCTPHKYIYGNLIDAQGLIQPSYATHRFTFDLIPVCKRIGNSCPREICTIDLKQNFDFSFMDLQCDSVRCINSEKDSQDHTSQESIENTNPRNTEFIINQFIQLILNTLENVDPNNEKQILLNVHLDSKTRLGNGFLYNLTLQTQSCNKNTDVANCLQKTHGKTKTCKVKIYIDKNKSPDNTRLVDLKCYYLRKNSRLKRQIPGGSRPRNVDDEEIINFANLALQRHSANFQGTYEPIVVNIVEATEQTVQGKSYKIKADIGTSDCPKGTRGACQLQSDSGIKRCLFSIWSRPWLNGSDALQTTVDCNLTERKRRSVISSPRNPNPKSNKQLGAPIHRNVDDEEIVNIANLALRQFVTKTYENNEPLIVNIIEATEQKGTGSLYKIKADIGESNCLKGTKGKCQLKENSDIERCTFSIWSRPWLNDAQFQVKTDCKLMEKVK